MQTTISAYIFFDFHCTGFVCLGCRKWQSWNLFGLFFAARRYITMSKYYFLQGTHWQSTHYAMQCFPKRPSLSNGLCSNCSKIPQTVYNKCAIHLLCNAVWWTFTLFHSCQVSAMGFVATLTIGFTTCFAVNAWILRYVFCVGTDIVAYFG